VDYDRKSPATEDILTAKVRIKNNAPKDAEMMNFDLDLPPGIEMQDLEVRQ
jgi:hypothetical protein